MERCAICLTHHEERRLRPKCHPEAAPDLYHHDGPPELIVAKCSICGAQVAGFLVKAGPFSIGGLAQ